MLSHRRRTYQPLIPGPTARRENAGVFASFPGELYEQFECAFAC
jgi:hypothetical protein